MNRNKNIVFGMLALVVSVVAQNDTLLSGEVKNMTLKLMLRSDTPASALSSTELRVTGLGVTLLYSQDSSYVTPNGGGNQVSGPAYIYSSAFHHLGNPLEVDNMLTFDNFEDAAIALGEPITQPI